MILGVVFFRRLNFREEIMNFSLKSDFIQEWLLLKGLSEKLLYIYNISGDLWKKYRLLKLIEKYNNKIFSRTFKDINSFIDESTVVFGHIQLISEKAFLYGIICPQSFHEIRCDLKKIREKTILHDKL